MKYWKDFKGSPLVEVECIINIDRFLPRPLFDESREKGKKAGFQIVRVIRQTPEFFRERVEEFKKRKEPLRPRRWEEKT